MARVVRLRAVVTSPEGARALLHAMDSSDPVELELTLRFAADDATRALSSRCLVLDRGGRYFEPPCGPRIDLRRSPVLRSLLDALVTARRERPGCACSREALVQACWPGARVATASAGNRLRVAISTLRRRGLREALLHDVDGWWLDASLPCEVVEH